jgi:hypothetical protein
MAGSVRGDNHQVTGGGTGHRHGYFRL